MKEFPAFLIIVKTNFDKVIAQFIDSKFESTRDMELKVGEFTENNCKLINN